MFARGAHISWGSSRCWWWRQGDAMVAWEWMGSLFAVCMWRINIWMIMLNWAGNFSSIHAPPLIYSGVYNIRRGSGWMVGWLDELSCSRKAEEKRNEFSVSDPSTTSINTGIKFHRFNWINCCGLSTNECWKGYLKERSSKHKDKWVVYQINIRHSFKTT